MKLKRILLVDDDIEDQYLFMEAINCLKFGVLCKTLNNGQEAMAHLENVQDYEMIFLDLNMPVINGLECLRAIRRNEKFKDIPVVIITTSINPADRQFCEEFGIDSYFYKPNTFPELCLGLNNIFTSMN